MTDHALLSAVLAEPLHLYTDEWAKRLGAGKEWVEQSARELRDDGLLQMFSAPHGVLLCPTLRAVDARNQVLRKDRTPCRTRS